MTITHCGRVIIIVTEFLKMPVSASVTRAAATASRVRNLFLRNDAVVRSVDDCKSRNSAVQCSTQSLIVARPVAAHRRTDDARLSDQSVVARGVVHRDRAVLGRHGQLLTVVAVHHARDC